MYVLGLHFSIVSLGSAQMQYRNCTTIIQQNLFTSFNYSGHTFVSIGCKVKSQLTQVFERE